MKIELPGGDPTGRVVRPHRQAESIPQLAVAADLRADREHLLLAEVRPKLSQYLDATCARARSAARNDGRHGQLTSGREGNDRLLRCVARRCTLRSDREGG